MIRCTMIRRRATGALRAAAAAAIVLALAAPAAADSAFQLIGAIKESFRAPSTMSGGVDGQNPARPIGALRAVGAYGSDGASTFDPTGLFIGPIRAPASRLCVLVNSRDGRYWGRATFSIQRAVRRREPFTWAETKYAEELARYPVEQMLMLATLAEDCDRFAASVAPIAFSSGAQRIVAHVSATAGVPYLRFLSENGAVAARASCETAATRISTHACVADGAKLAPGDYRMQIEILGDEPGQDVVETYNVFVGR